MVKGLLADKVKVLVAGSEGVSINIVEIDLVAFGVTEIFKHIAGETKRALFELIDVRRSIELKRIRVKAAKKKVPARAADQRIGPSPSIQRIVRSRTSEHVV
jgi:hypothetical protein